jgi:predicted nucleotidyltransferase
MSPEVDALAAKVASALAPVESVRVAWLFGSQVRGRARGDSDLDLAVKFDRSLDGRARELCRREIVAALTDALGPLGERTDVVDVDRAGTGVCFAALREGVRVLARSEEERIDASVRILRMYDDQRAFRELFERAGIRAGLAMGEQARGRG